MLEQLNEAQREAATHIDGPLLILAGAGSGKTKTLTTRLAYLIGEVGIDPANTLTLTFTNKAAAEMRDRALQLLDDRTAPILRFCALSTNSACSFSSSTSAAWGEKTASSSSTATTKSA